MDWSIKWVNKYTFDDISKYYQTYLDTRSSPTRISKVFEWRSSRIWIISFWGRRVQWNVVGESVSTLDLLFPLSVCILFLPAVSDTFRFTCCWKNLILLHENFFLYTKCPLSSRKVLIRECLNFMPSIDKFVFADQMPWYTKSSLSLCHKLLILLRYSKYSILFIRYHQYVIWWYYKHLINLNIYVVSIYPIMFMISCNR